MSHFSDQERTITCATSPLEMANSASFDSASSPHLNSLSSASSRPDSDKMSSDSEVKNMVETPCIAPMSEEIRIAIASSLRNSIQTLAEAVAAPLAGFERLSIEMYNVRSTRSYGDYDDDEWRRTPSEWVDVVLRRTRFVVCVCNKEFMEDWDYNRHSGDVMCNEASLVGRISQHVSGCMNYGQHDKVQRKFIVAVLHESDLQYVPEKLKDCSYFVLNCDAKYRELVRHLQGIPAVCLEMPYISSRL